MRHIILLLAMVGWVCDTVWVTGEEREREVGGIYAFTPRNFLLSTVGNSAEDLMASNANSFIVLDV